MKYQYKICSLLILAIFVASCSDHPMVAARSDVFQQNSTNINYPQNEEYEVYNVVLEQRERAHKKNRFVISTETVFYSDPFEEPITTLDKLKKRSSERISIEVISSLLEINKERYKLEDNFDKQIRHFLIGKKDIQRFFSNEAGWAEFNRQHPSGELIQFSRVGFDSKRLNAIVYASFLNGLKSGEGYFFLLKHTNDGWKIDEQFEVWVS